MAGRLQRGAEEGAGRSLPVGAGDVKHRRQIEMRVAEPVHQTGDAVEAEDVRVRLLDASGDPAVGDRAATELAAAGFEVVELPDEHARIDDATSPDRAALARDDPARDLPDLVRLGADDDRVPRVRTALIAAHEVGVLGEQVDDLPLSLVAPLGAQNN